MCSTGDRPYIARSSGLPAYMPVSGLGGTTEQTCMFVCVRVYVCHTRPLCLPVIILARQQLTTRKHATANPVPYVRPYIAYAP